MAWQQDPSGARSPWVGESVAQRSVPPPAWQAGAAGPSAAYSPGYEPSGSLQRSSRRRLRGWLTTGLLAIGFGLAALVLCAYFGAALGVSTALYGLVFAAIPLGVIVPTFLWLDRFEAEPTKYLIVTFLWGALVATLIAGVLNTGAAAVLNEAADPMAGLAATAVFVAPVVEESLKGVAVLLVWRLRRREFDGIIDGMVYAGIVAAGFAFTENIQYLGQAYAQGGSEMLAGTFLGRGLMSPFAHPMFTVMIGIGIGIASTARSTVVRFAASVGGWVLAVLAHGLWNLSAVTGGAGQLVGYFLVGVPIFGGYAALVVWARRREGRLIGRHLSPYADAGWLSTSEVAMLSSMPHRREARMWARSNGGSTGLKAMRAFQDSASELGLLRSRMYHQAADEAALAAERRLLDALVLSRRAFIGSTAS